MIAKKMDNMLKVSKLRLNTTDGSITGAELAIRDSQGYETLCSASLIEGYGFEHPVFLTNEEIDDGLVLAIDAINGTVYELPWLGLFSHENTIHVPYFYVNSNKTVVMGFEDADETESEVYMYVVTHQMIFCMEKDSYLYLVQLIIPHSIRGMISTIALMKQK